MSYIDITGHITDIVKLKIYLKQKGQANKKKLLPASEMQNDDEVLFV